MRKPHDAFLAIEWICDVQVRLDETERPSCDEEVQVPSALPFIGTGRKSEFHLRETTICVALLWLSESRLSFPHFSIIVKLLERKEAEVFLWSGISLETWSFGLNEKDELRNVSSAKD